MAERLEMPTAVAQAELGIAKVFHRIDAPEAAKADFASAQSMQDIGKRLLQSVGLTEPDDLSIQAAIEANDTFIATLEQIRDRARN
jgi:hypothetical protein